MAVVYYKFKSEQHFGSVPVDAWNISVRDLKEKIFQIRLFQKEESLKSKRRRGKDSLVLTDARTNEDYTNEATLIPRNASVVVRRVPPGMPSMPIVIEREESKDSANRIETSESRSTLSVADSSGMNPMTAKEVEEDDFGEDIFAIPKVGAVQSSNLAQKEKVVDERKIEELADKKSEEYIVNFGQGRFLGSRTPPEGYICYRCQVPGHFIQHCPTNGDLDHDIRRLRRPAGIPKSMLAEASEGSYALPNGAVAALKPNNDSFLEEIARLPSTYPLSDLPPEMRCPLCKEIMKDAVFTSKCCFRSFCDKCIRDHIISKSTCQCGATEILADTLIPNKTLRDIIKQFMESAVNSCIENATSSSQLSERNSSCCEQPKVPVPAVSEILKEECAPTCEDFTSNRKRGPYGKETAMATPGKAWEGKETSSKSEVTLQQAKSGKEPDSHGQSPPRVKDKIQQRQPGGEPGKKKRKKPCGAANDLHWGMTQDSMALNPFMTFGPAYLPHWSSMQWEVNGYMAPYGAVPRMAYTADSFENLLVVPCLKR